jgi:hypothetical protein
MFTRGNWVDWLITESAADRLHLYWSPKVIEEASRVRLWIWLKRELRADSSSFGSSGWKRLWRRYSEETHAWFARLSPHIRVIEDRPPHELAWIEPHPDPNDAWLWNTARRVNADFVLTVDLDDAPPPDPAGLRQHERILFVHPGMFRVIQGLWDELVSTGVVPTDLESWVRDSVGGENTISVVTIVAALRLELARMADEAGAAPGEVGPGRVRPGPRAD